MVAMHCWTQSVASNPNCNFISVIIWILCCIFHAFSCWCRRNIRFISEKTTSCTKKHFSKTQKNAECHMDTAERRTCHFLACLFKVSLLRGGWGWRVVTFNFHVEIHPELLNVSLMSHRTKLLNVDPYCTLWPLEQLLPHDKPP